MLLRKLKPTTMGNICIIPARGGSKRIPRKNIKPFLGKPIIAYSIQAAINSGLFEEVMVSTDDQEIAQVAQEFGAAVPFLRSAENADDFATTADVLNEVLAQYSAQNKHFDLACCLYATAPLVTVSALKQGLNKLVVNNFDSVFPVAEYSFTIWRSLKFEANRVAMNWPENTNTRSQDLPPAYHDAGQWYWFNPRTFNDKLVTKNSGAVVLEQHLVQDIDTIQDWQIAELKFKIKKH